MCAPFLTALFARLLAVPTDARPLCAIHRMPDKRIPKGNLKMRTEQDYGTVCGTEDMCSTDEELKLVYGKMAKNNNIAKGGAAGAEAGAGDAEGEGTGAGAGAGAGAN